MMKNKGLNNILAVLFTILTFHIGFSQTTMVKGRITDQNKEAVPFAAVVMFEYPTKGVYADNNGYYEFEVPPGENLTLIFSHTEYSKKIKVLLKSGETKILNVLLKSVDLEEIVIKAGGDGENMHRMDSKNANYIPSISGDRVIELVKSSFAGSRNEMSTQYTVRGGNFDENLIYVNDIEVYRPLLIRSGQQEGLSFINSDLVSEIMFSAGGFDAKYGDKMSSVLDIKYKKPKKFAGSVSASLMGASAHIENSRGNLSYLLGVRYKSNQYILNSLQTKGEYSPKFIDVQTYLTYDLNSKLELSFLGNYANNSYEMKPESRETDFGTIQQALRLKIYFEGQELDAFETYFGAFTTTYKPSKRSRLSFIASAFRSFEKETYDILGEYWLHELKKELGEGIGETVGPPRGVGGFLDHARNYLDATVYNLQHKGRIATNNHFIQWGAKYQREIIDDELSEWNMIDSAGYSLPHPPDSIGYVGHQPAQSLELQYVLRSANYLESNRYSAFIQDKLTFKVDSGASLFLIAGIRATYWDYNDEFLFSPRATLAYRPAWKRDVGFRFSSGYYYQPPFYRELRGLDGQINEDLKAQKSMHFVLGSDWNFQAWKRPFKFITELYYKHLDNLVPYEIDNVRIRYYAENSAKGYAYGLDMKVNGEFVKGIESWASLSLMRTMENIDGDYYLVNYNAAGERITANTIDYNIAYTEKQDIGYRPRPTDQALNFSLFFQDYLPRNPTYKMHLNLVYASRIPLDLPGTKNFKPEIMEIPPYKRVDIGFSKQIKDEDSMKGNRGVLKYFKSLWITAEIFNLLQVNNTVSYIWISDVNNRQFAVPNYLTSRRLNVRIIAGF